MLTLVVVELLVTASCFAAPRRRNKAVRQGSDIDSSNVSGLLMFAPAVGAGLLMAFSRTLWAYATITEVYTLNALLVLLVFFLVLRWRRTIETRMDSSVAVATHDTWIYAAAFVFGLAMGVHHVTVALTLPAIAVVVYRTEGLKFFTSRRLLYAALISIGALILVYSYLPWAASRSPAMNWGNPRSLQEIWWHITGRQYRVFFSFSPATMGAQFVEFCRMALHEFGYAWLPLTLSLAAGGARERLQARPHSFLVFAIDPARRPDLRAELRNCRGQRRRPFAGIHFDRDCGRARCPLVDSTCCFKPFADLETVCGCCDCDCPDIGYSLRCELAIQQSQALLHCR